MQTNSTNKTYLSPRDGILKEKDGGFSVGKIEFQRQKTKAHR